MVKNKLNIYASEIKKNRVERTPTDWNIVKLGDLCDPRKEIIQPSGKGNIKFIGLEHIDPGFTRTNTYITDKDIKSLKFKFYRGDILYGKLRPYLDKAIIADTDGICSTDIIVMIPNYNKSNAEYLIYVIHSRKFICHAVSNTSGTNHPRTSWKAITKFEFPLPPLPEQKKIAEVLSTIDQGIEKVREAIEKTQRLKKGLMEELLTKGIGHKEFKETEIGRIPRDWNLQKLSDLAEVKGGKRLPKGHSLIDYETPYPYIRVVDFKSMGVDLSSIKYLKPETHKSIKQYTISSNDVYISIDGANLTENSAKLSNLKKITKQFLAYILNSQIGQKQILAYIGKAQQPKLALFRIEKIKIPIPSISEQQKISSTLSSVDRQLESLTNRKEKLEKIKKGLMEDLLTGKKRVKLS